MIQSTTAHQSPNGYVPALTGLRAVAAYLVFLHHYNPATPGTFSYRLADQGYIGVTIFFVLSGFLIYHRYADAYMSGKNWSWQTYLQNRFVRIYPLYAVLLLATAGAYWLAGRPMSWLIFGLNVTLLKGFFDAYKFSGIAQSWSLTVEVCFYVLAPFLFVGLNRWGTTVLISIGLVWATGGQTNPVERLSFIWFYTFFGRSFEFLAGMWLARCWHQNQLPHLPQAAWAGLICMLACVGWQADFVSPTTNQISLLWSEVLVYNFLLPVCIVLFFLGLITGNSPIHRFLSWPIMQLLGRGSYAFYLIHVGVVANGLQRVGVMNRWLLFGLLVITAQGLYFFVEKPLQRRLRAK